MSDWSVALLIVAAVFAVYRLFFSGSSELPSRTGRSSDFARWLERLLESDEKSAFLVIEVEGGPDFFQFAKSEGGLELDFPLVNARQRDQEVAVRAAAERLGLTQSKNSTSRSVDYAVGDQPVQIARRTETLFGEGLGVSLEGGFVFKWHKMEPPG